MVVGAPSDDHAGPFSGSVYVFGRNQGGADNWGEVEKLTASDAEPEANFGRSLAISADTVVIGARRWAGTTSDSAYVFERNKGGPDNWGEVKKLTATVDGTGFGISLSISTDTILVGAHGSASVFSRNQGGADNWGEVNTLTASDGAAGDDFGAAVGINADTALVGAPQDDVNKGAAYVIVPGDRPPSELTIIQPPDGAVFNSGTNIVFQSTATDPEDGDIRASTVWTSNIQEGSKTGGVVETSNLIDGVHIITATVTDSAGNTLSKSITVTISNNPPTVSIIQPADGSTFASSETINAQGAATDPEDGDISESIVWTSDIQEGSREGAVIEVTNAIDGVHVITASITDSLGNTVTDSITITIGPPPE